MINQHSPADIDAADIRPTELMLNKRPCIEADRRFLLQRREQWVHVVCPACQHVYSSPFGEKDGFSYVQCGECATVFTNPRPSLELLHEFYATSENYAYWNEHVFPATEDVRRTHIFRPRAERLERYCRQFSLGMGTFMEIGAGFGTFCEEVAARQLFDRIVAVEPTPDLAETCRKKGFEVIGEPVENVHAREVADVIAAFEVIEHLFCPRDFIRQCNRLLRSGGLVVLSCPNVRGFDVSELGLASGTFDHEHLNYFHPDSLRRLLQDCGFEVVDVSTPGRLDAGIVRTKVLEGSRSLEGKPFLQMVLLDRWNELGMVFQDFLSENLMSSHMWIVARKPARTGA